MFIKNTDEIEGYLIEYIKSIKDEFLIVYFYKLKSDWKILLTNDDEITQTACIMKGKQTNKYYLYFNNNFITKNIKDKKQLIFVFLHEIFHKIKGDLLREYCNYYFMSSHVSNIVFDIAINTMLIKNYVKEGFYFLKEFYKDTDYVANFLLSPAFEITDIPDIYSNGEKQEEIIKRIKEKKFKDEHIIKNKEDLAKWYIDAWFNDASLQKLIEVLESIVEFSLPPFFILLGSHGYDLDDMIEQNIDIEDEFENNNSNELIKAIRAAMQEEGDRILNDKVITTKRGILPSFGRRELMLLYKKKYPFFFPNTIEDMAQVYKNVNLYIDVSFSVENFLSFVYGLVNSVKAYLNDRVFIFSGEVEEMSINQLKKGLVLSTGGTNFDELVSHAITNDFKKILVITDGRGDISKDLINEIKKRRMEIFVVLLDDIYFYNNGFQTVAKKVWVLKKNEEEI